MEQLSILSLTQQTVVIAVMFPTVILGAVPAFLGEYMPHNIIMCTTIEVVIYIFVFKTSTQIYSNNLIWTNKDVHLASLNRCSTLFFCVWWVFIFWTMSNDVFQILILPKIWKRSHNNMITKYWDPCSWWGSRNSDLGTLVLKLAPWLMPGFPWIQFLYWSQTFSSYTISMVAKFNMNE